MKIVVINGTEVKGCTYKIKESFLEELRDGNSVIEYYLPKDSPNFCRGCKVCFRIGEDECPHHMYIKPIWNSILESDLIVFAYPVYVMRAPGQIKAFLDHLGCHWMVHRPKKEMFKKRAAIITQGISAMNKGAQKDVKTSLNWLGVSDVKMLGMGLNEEVIWEKISENQRNKLMNKAKKFALNYKAEKKMNTGIQTNLRFNLLRIMRKRMKKNGDRSVDTMYWEEQGWI